MKHSLRMLLIMLLFVMFVSCEQKDTSIPTNNNFVSLTFGLDSTNEPLMHKAAIKLNDLVSKRSNHTLKINIQTVKTSDNSQVLIKLAQTGKLDIIATPTSNLSNFVPSMLFFDIPFLFSEKEDIYELIDGSLGDHILSKLNPLGLKGLTIWGNGFKQFSSNSPLLTPSDFENLTFATRSNPLIKDQFKTLNAKPVAIDISRVKESLANNLVDGQESSLAFINNNRLDKLQNTLTLSNHAYLCDIIAINSNNYNKLSKEHKEILRRSINDITNWQREELRKSEENLTVQFQSRDISVNMLFPSNKLAFQKELSEIKNKYWEVIGSDIMILADEFIHNKYGTDRYDSFIIGLNATFSGPEKVSGKAIRLGLQMATEEVNKSGGLLGKPIRIVQTDAMLNPSIGLTNVKSLIHSKNRLLAIFGGKHTPVVIEALQAIHEQRIPYLLSWSSSEELVNNGYEPNYVFRLSANDKDAARFLVKKALENANRIALVGMNTIWGKSNIKKMEFYLNQFGLTPTSVVIFDINKNKFNKTVAELAKTNTELVIYIGRADSLIQFITSMKEQDVKLDILSHWGITGSSMHNRLKEVSQGFAIKYIQTRASKFFDTQNFQDAFNSCKLCDWDVSNKRFLPATVHAYDLAMMLFQSIKESGKTDHESIKKGLENIQTFNGLMGNYTKPFSAENHEALKESDYYLKSLN